MPPANSPVEEAARPARSRTSARTSSPSASFLPVFRELGSPVLDLASTLTIQAEDDVDAENVGFLRNIPRDNMSHAPSSAPAAQEAPPPDRRQSRVSDREQAYRDLLNESLLGHRPFRSPWTEVARARVQGPYGDHVPNQQSLYDWAPNMEEGDLHELEDILAELREQQPNTHPDVLRSLSRTALDADREARSRTGTRTHQPYSGGASSHDTSLRSAAILQSVRRNRLYARSRDIMQRYILDRERAGPDAEDRDRSSPSMWLRLAENSNDSNNRYELNRLAWQATQRLAMQSNGSRTSEIQRQIADHRTTAQRRHDFIQRLHYPGSRSQDDPCGVPMKFEGAIKMLDQVRLPGVDMDALIKQAQEDRKLQWTTLEQSKLLKLSKGVSPSATSWLAPGTIFCGFQQAAPMSTSGAMTSRPEQSQPSRTQESLGANPRGSTGAVGTVGGGRVHEYSSAPSSSNNPHFQHGSTSSSTNPPYDRWAVRVALHDVDFERMTLQATMEAFNVPSPSAPSSSDYYPVSAVRSTTSPTLSQYPDHPVSSQPPAHVRPQDLHLNLPTRHQSTSSRPAAPSASHSVTYNSAIPPKTTFSTYLEGEIIDFDIHTLATHSFPSTPADDAKYWRRLEPFKSLPDEELARCVADPEWLARNIRDRYILMRWKERCFVKEVLGASSSSCLRRPVSALDGIRNSRRSRTRSSADGSGSQDTHIGSDAVTPANSAAAPSSASEAPAASPSRRDVDRTEREVHNGVGLSISGFYYVCLRRSDGQIEGLYFDPQSSPYQYLELKVDGRGGSGTWEFV